MNVCDSFAGPPFTMGNIEITVNVVKHKIVSVNQYSIIGLVKAFRKSYKI